MPIRVEVICAWPRRHASVSLVLPEGATVGDAVAASGLAMDEITAFGVFGERAGSDDVLRDGDRVELLRPLTIDPKEARRQRAVRQRPK